MDYHHVPITRTLRFNLINAHNGLRNRAAAKHQISSMRLVRWDTELERMAEIHIRLCSTLYAIDECTQLPREYNMENRYTLITQNSAFVVSSFLPKYYETSIVTTWYTESQIANYTTIDGNGTVKYTKITNYTQMIYARTERIGCALGRFSTGYRLVCNYYPSLDPNMNAYQVGEPCSKCPRSMPLCDDFFDGLCIGDAANRHSPWMIHAVLWFIYFCM